MEVLGTCPNCNHVRFDVDEPHECPPACYMEMHHRAIREAIASEDTRDPAEPGEGPTITLPTFVGLVAACTGQSLQYVSPYTDRLSVESTLIAEIELHLL